MNQTVIAFTRDDREYQAAALKRRGNVLSLLGVYRRPKNETNWSAWGRGILSSLGYADRTGKSDLMVVAGFETAKVLFYRINTPPVNAQQLAELVRLQAEALLPLPMEQMELFWRRDTDPAGRTAVTLAAVRKSGLQAFLREIQPLAPDRVLLESEGLVKTWRLLFAGDNDRTAIIYIGRSKSQICLAEGGKIIQAINLDSIRGALEGEINSAERSAEKLAQDIFSVLRIFGDTSIPIQLLSDGSEPLEKTDLYLRKVGLNCHCVRMDEARLHYDAIDKEQDLFEFLLPIAAAVLALEPEEQTLNIFTAAQITQRQKEAKSLLHSIKKAAAAAFVMAILWAITAYGTDAIKLGKIEKYLYNPDLNINVNQLQELQRIKKFVAGQRSDVLGLLKLINEVVPAGMILDSIDLKKRQPVTLAGHTGDVKLMEKLQEKLIDIPGIKNIRPQLSPAKGNDKKSNEINFTLSFEYRQYGK